jgi:peptidoglycan/xylan/chitin deacetylase (PgdA/CDA1 family)
MHFSKQKLKWLEVILSERLIDGVVLQPSSDNSVYLHLQGHDNHIEIKSNNPQSFFLDSKKSSAFWDYDCYRWKSVFGGKIIAPGCYELDAPLICKTDHGYRVGYDILDLIYFMLSRVEEVGSVDLDQHGRFPSTSSHAFKHDYLEIPIVDVWIDIIGQVMQRLWPSIKLKCHYFNIKVSHDVDVPSRYIFQGFSGMLRRMAGDILKRGDFLSAFSAPYVRLKSHDRLPVKDSLNKFSWLMDLSEKHNLTSAFYFICGKSHKETDADYEVEHPAIRSLMREIHTRGHEIGLHPSYNTCHTPSAIIREAKELRKICSEENIEQKEWGGRMHYLRWDHPTTLYGWEDAKMSYDSTLGYADRVGFRCGTCFEYPAYDPVSDRQLNVRIRPLIAMDVTVLSKGYMGLGASKDAHIKLTELKNACRSVNGTFTLLWHNNQLETSKLRNLYSSLLECKK